MNNFLESEFGMHLREMASHAMAIAISALLVSLAFLAFGLTRPEVYAASATVRVIVDEQLADDGSITAFQTRSLAEVSTSTDLVTAAARRAGITSDVEAVRDRISVEVRTTPGYLDVMTTGPTPTDAADLANAMAAALIDRVQLDATPESGRSAIVIDSADVADTVPTATKRQAITAAVALGLLSAIVVGEGLVGWRLLRGRFSPIDPGVELERLIGAPVLDLRDGKSMLPFYLDRLSERATLTVLQAGEQPSADVALSLARSSGEVHRRVLLVDGDTGRPVMHTALGESQSPGLAEVAQGSQPMRAVVRPARHDMRAAVLTAGRHDREHNTGADLLPTLQRVVGEVGADQVIVSITQTSSTDEILRATHAFPHAVVLAIDPTALGVKDVRTLLETLRSVKANVIAGVITRPSVEGMAL